MRSVIFMVPAAPLRQLYLSHSEDETCRAARAGRDPLRRRLRRRYAADRRSLHERNRGVRERSRHAAGLSRGDPRAGRLAAWGVRLPGALRRPRHPDAGRPAERARGDEPRGAQGQPRRPGEGRDGHRQHRRVLGSQPAEGGLRDEPARGRVAFRLPRARRLALVDDDRGAEGGRRDHLARSRALEELLRARAHVVALQPPDRGDARLHRHEVREAARDRRGEHARLQGGLELRRDLRGLRGLVRDRAGEARARYVSPDLRELGSDVRADRREQALRAAAVPRGLSDHARLRRSRAAREHEALRRPHLPGGGRDRGLGCRAGGGVRRLARRDDLGRTRASSSSRRPSGSP